MLFKTWTTHNPQFSWFSWQDWVWVLGLFFVLVVVAKAAKESATRSRSKISLVFTRTVENASQNNLFPTSALEPSINKQAKEVLGWEHWEQLTENLLWKDEVDVWQLQGNSLMNMDGSIILGGSMSVNSLNLCLGSLILRVWCFAWSAHCVKRAQARPAAVCLLCSLSVSTYHSPSFLSRDLTVGALKVFLIRSQSIDKSPQNMFAFTR